MKLEGICALITGAADGIGKAVTKRFLERGAKFVAILDYNKAKGEETVQEFANQFGKDRVRFFLCDVAKDDELGDAFKEAFNVNHRLDVVINNAGVDDEHPNVLQINLGAVITGSYLAKQYMSKQNGGHGGVLINTGSIAGLLSYEKARYAATKFGVVGFSLSITVEDRSFTTDDIRVGVICPSFLSTELSREGKANRIFIQMSQVVDAFVLLVEDETKHSCCVRITPAKGIDLHPAMKRDEFIQEFKLYGE
ncbi:15-hydroxyprostaglandin dehydrogenase [NAD(+)]-like [Apostichopus japonicus]|uniref:15-hydroxyprostaglandin dehydrogenase [NAD(+)]-like n=1 Tax=Stichopus japonicus TaxID=307972 RepID=UPI003AB50E46